MEDTDKNNLKLKIHLSCNIIIKNTFKQSTQCLKKFLTSFVLLVSQVFWFYPGDKKSVRNACEILPDFTYHANPG